MKKRTISVVIALMAIGLVVTIKHGEPIQSQALATMTISTTDKTDAELNSYYATANGKVGAALKTALHQRIRNHTAFSYADTIDMMKITDRNWTLSPMTTAELTDWVPSNDTGNAGDPYLYLMYGGLYNNDSATAYKWSADHTAIWNKEHIWAKSHGGFGEDRPAGTDLHHLRAADQYHNSTMHSNYDYDNVTSNIVYGKDERGNTTTAKRGNSVNSPTVKVFEPADEDKGDIARALFYMATRYATWISVTDPILELRDVQTFTETSLTGTPENPGGYAYLSTLLEWNRLDPVSDFEIHRNNLIDVNFQKNRNPYIDHPEWADMVYNPSYTGPAASTSAGSTCVIGDCDNLDPVVKVLTSITITTPAKTAFNLDDEFAVGPLVVTAHYDDGSSHPIGDYTTNPALGTSLSTSGTRTVVISHTHAGVTKTVSYQINVSTTTRDLESISLDTGDLPLTWTQGSEFASAGLAVTAHFTTGASEIVNTFTTNPAEGDVLSTLGLQNITVSYTNKGITRTKSFTINVVAPSGTTSILLNYTNLGMTTSFPSGPTSATVDDIDFTYEEMRRNAGISGRATGTHKLYNSTALTYITSIVFNVKTPGVTTINDMTPTMYAGTSVAPSSGTQINKTIDETNMNITFTFPASTYTYFYYSYTTTKMTTYNSITINYGTQPAPTGPEVDALAFANKFINTTSDYCNVNNGSAIPWTQLGVDYSDLTSDAKNYIYNDISTSGTIYEMKTRYQFLIGKYTTFAGNNWLKNGSGSPLYAASITTNNNGNSNSKTLLFAASVGLAIALFYLALRKKNTTTN